MALQEREVDLLVQALRGFVARVQAGTVSSDPMVIGDFPLAQVTVDLNTTAELAALINRYFREQGKNANNPARGLTRNLPET